MKVQTTRFGTIDVQEDQVVTLADGMLGFSECTRFTLITDEIGEPFKWMQSLDMPTLAFVVIDPALILPGYHFSVKKEQIRSLDTDDVDELQVYVIVTMAGNLLDITVNLQGPLVVNKQNRVGLQLVLSDPKFSTRHPLFTDTPDTETEWTEAVKKENKVASMRVAIAG
ncbi:MAG: flagellar assembly protein FliW [Candidatus Lambdaproteobacteria bacterium]|nr:flagellar assembly protein FliW [Candidatus Lambdaproteobacteria bacterium]